VVAGLIKSTGCQLVIRVLGRQARKWARITKEQNREGGKAQSGQYMASWAGLLLLVSESTSLVVRLCRRGRRAP